jgi:hypothetical protein
MTESNWELTKARSQYHFDTDRWNPKWDRVEHLGYIQPCWVTELAEAIEQAKPVTWRTRGKPGDTKIRSSQEHDREEYDLESYGMDKNYVVTNINYAIAPVFQTIADKFSLQDCMARIHVQHPGQVWNLHLDKLEKWMPADPTQVVRYFVQLTDWQQGHFWSYGNYMWSGWHAGDVSTFDWIHVPHSTANAGHSPRATLQITGIKTQETDKFLNNLKDQNETTTPHIDNGPAWRR